MQAVLFDGAAPSWWAQTHKLVKMQARAADGGLTAARGENTHIHNTRAHTYLCTDTVAHGGQLTSQHIAINSISAGWHRDVLLLSWSAQARNHVVRGLACLLA
jgi:microcompartment protein CcmK/EutM